MHGEHGIKRRHTHRRLRPRLLPFAMRSKGTRNSNNHSASLIGSYFLVAIGFVILAFN
ncbi:hypothetical protein KDH_12500 [Dictyobacter sp. S3.2.2.5]|uniref:Uncharacterized protein n=1 Tax=Dictyobacter halimunensis TaxID=3026934 RepID=A0ABQ6FJK1_9CHLR|nr:hypothetical protein KDH_12500 [Dictyobacter sp. S3.2.2.5]